MVGRCPFHLRALPDLLRHLVAVEVGKDTSDHHSCRIIAMVGAMAQREFLCRPPHWITGPICARYNIYERGILIELRACLRGMGILATEEKSIGAPKRRR